MRFGDAVTVEDYGKSVGGRSLTLIRVARPTSAATPRPAVLLTQAIHGDEYLGVADQLPSELLQRANAYPSFQAFLDGGGILYVVPVANPDGYAANRRENDRGMDLNRDFDVRRYATRLADAQAGRATYSVEQLSVLESYVSGPKLTQPESAALTTGLRDAFQRDRARLKIAIDYHCCLTDEAGALIHEWGDTQEVRDGTIAGGDVLRYERTAPIFLRHFPGYKWGSGLQTLGYMSFGSVDEWLYEAFTESAPLTFTYEAQGRGDAPRKLRSHAMFLEALLAERDLVSL